MGRAAAACQSARERAKDGALKGAAAAVILAGA